MEMSFHTSQNRNLLKPKAKFNNFKSKPPKFYAFMYIIITENMEWNDHLNPQITKFSKVCYIVEASVEIRTTHAMRVSVLLYFYLLFNDPIQGF